MVRLFHDDRVRGSSISSDRGLLLYRDLNDALGLGDMAAGSLTDPHGGKNGQHCLGDLLHQSIFLRLAGCEDVNDADRLRRDLVMRQLVGGRAVERLGYATPAEAEVRFRAPIENLAWQPEPSRTVSTEPGRFRGEKARIEEERCLFHVACTQARSTLLILRVSGFDTPFGYWHVPAEPAKPKPGQRELFASPSVVSTGAMRPRAARSGGRRGWRG